MPVRLTRRSSSRRNVQPHRLEGVNKGSIGGGQRVDGNSLQRPAFCRVITGE